MTHDRVAVPITVFGSAGSAETAHALVFAPVTPSWDGGTFFAPITGLLTRAGFRVTVVDTIFLRDEEADSMTALVARWRAQLPSFETVELLCGNGLGGAVAQALLSDVSPATAVLLVSGPARTDMILEERLTQIADLAAVGRVDAALTLLNRRLLPHGKDPVDDAALPGNADEESGRRLAAMRLLRGIDVSAAVKAHPGPLLQIVGSHSQLVTRQHTAAAPHHRVHVVNGAGMRPHTERTAEVSELVKAFLRERVFR
jgi:pimeloyl-ACP methyl ester carboxylesterase